MIKKLFSIYDEKTQYFLPPFLGHNNQDALREIQRMLMQSQATIISQFPDDYKLYCIGSFDDSNAYLEVLKQPVVICVLSDLVPERSKPNENDPVPMDNDN